MSHEFQVALVRGGITAVIAGGVSFFSTLQMGLSAGEAGIAAGLMICTSLAARFGVEGAVDSKRANTTPSS